MAEARLRFIVRTPHAVVLDANIVSVRVLTQTGQVGLRARMEPIVLAVEAGLALLRTERGVQFAGSAGGLLSCDGVQATLFTPLGVVGQDAATVQAALDLALGEPTAEQKVRATLDRLESRILTELHRQPVARPVTTGERK